MKIAQVVCAFPPYRGGIGESAKTLGGYLAAENEVHTFTLLPKNADRNNLEKDGVTYLSPWLRYGHGGLPLSLLFSLRRYDCIYLHYPFFGAAEIVWLYKLIHPRIKLVLHYHMDVTFSSLIAKLLSLPSRLIKKSLIKKADAIIASSLDYAKNCGLKPEYTRYAQKIKAIPFSVDIERYHPKIKESNSSLAAKAKNIVEFVTNKIIKRGRTQFLFVGGLDKAHYFKGVPVLLEALSRLKSGSWRLEIVGSGDLQAGYETLAQELGIERYIKFSGNVSGDNLPRCYQEADCLVLPSTNSNEAFGIVLIEAMSSGLPVIASALPGVRSVFDEGKQGYYCQPGDIVSLKEALEKIASNPNRRREMGRAARSLAVSRYSEEAVKGKILNIFSRL
jgi:glycosyltransferase involved in cell wall biosynthesis